MTAVSFFLITSRNANFRTTQLRFSVSNLWLGILKAATHILNSSSLIYSDIKCFTLVVAHYAR